MTKVNFLNIHINNITLENLLEKTNNEKMFIVTPNVDHLVKLKQDTDFLKVYRIADYVVCDSRIIQCTMNLLGTPIKEKISGSDLFPAFYQYHQLNENIKIFLLGGKSSVAQKAKMNINRKVNREIVVDALSPSFGFEKNESECLEIVKRINLSGANVLAIGVGAPKQEKWILKYRHLLPNVRIYFPVGATIDFEAGDVSRAPKWMSNSGLEWFYRLISDPKRLWKRYLVDSIPFFIDVFKYVSHQYNNDPLLDLKSLPLGELLCKAGLLSPAQVNLILPMQKERNHRIRFGELASELGLLSPQTVDFFAEELPIIIEEKRILSIEEYLQQANLISRLHMKSSIKNKSKSYFNRLSSEHNNLSPRTIKWFQDLNTILQSA